MHTNSIVKHSNPKISNLDLTWTMCIFHDINTYRVVIFFRAPILGVKCPVNPIIASELQGNTTCTSIYYLPRTMKVMIDCHVSPSSADQIFKRKQSLENILHLNNIVVCVTVHTWPSTRIHLIIIPVIKLASWSIEW